MNKDDIRKTIASGDLKKAIVALMDAASDTSDENTAMMLYSRLNRLERNEMMGTMGYSEVNMERNRLTQSALLLLSDLPDQFTPAPTPISTPPPADSPPIVPPQVKSPTQPKKMFISYAREDYDYVERLKKFMTPLQRDGLVEAWSDSNLVTGELWNEAIQKAMEEADIILYMVSADFLYSTFITENERVWANKHAATKNTIIVPVIVRPCSWNAEDFAVYNAIPKDEKGRLTPVSKWGDQDSANLALVDQLRTILK